MLPSTLRTIPTGCVRPSSTKITSRKHQSSSTVILAEADGFSKDILAERSVNWLGASVEMDKRLVALPTELAVGWNSRSAERPRPVRPFKSQSPRSLELLGIFFRSEKYAIIDEITQTITSANFDNNVDHKERTPSQMSSRNHSKFSYYEAANLKQYRRPDKSIHLVNTFKGNKQEWEDTRTGSWGVNWSG